MSSSKSYSLALSATVLLGVALFVAAAVISRSKLDSTNSSEIQNKKESEEKLGEGEDDFRCAAERVKNLTVTDTETLLRLYGLFKRVTFGRAQSKDKPWEPTARAKWNAWNDCRDLSKREAADLYVDLVNNIENQSSSQPRSSPSKPSLGPKVSKMVTPEDQTGSIAFVGSHFFDAAREDFSCLKDHLQTHPELVSMHDEENRTLLHWAVDSDCLDATVLLLEHGAEIDVKDSDGLTPLGYAASSDLAELALFLVNAGARVSTASVDQSADELTRDPALKEELRKAKNSQT